MIDGCPLVETGHSLAYEVLVLYFTKLIGYVRAYCINTYLICTNNASLLYVVLSFIGVTHLPAFDVWKGHKYLPVKSPRSKQGWVQDVNSVGGSQYNNICLLGETWQLKAANFCFIPA